MKRYLSYIWLLFAALIVAMPLNAQDDIYRVESMPFSSKAYNDFSAVLYRDGIVFCSDRRKNIFRAFTNEKNESQVDLYIARKVDSLTWGRPEFFSDELNSVKFEGPMTFSPDGNTMYFTRNYDSDKQNRKSDNPNFGIFSATYDGSVWSNITPFEHNDPSYKLGHPFLTTDGTRMFIVSTRPGGNGGADIYYCDRVNGNWSTPVNAGPQVNTSGNEQYPFFHPNGRLYYSSDGPLSDGSLDIFFSVLINDQWTAPERLGAPFNSTADDFAFISDESLSNGYFSSNRDRTDNIYNFSTLYESFTGCPLILKNDHTYIIEEPNVHRIDTMHHILEWDLGDGNFKRGASVEHTFLEEGTYTIKLNVIDSLSGEILYNQVTYVLPIKDIEQVYITSVDTTVVNEPVRFDNQRTKLANFTIQSYLWNFGDGNITTGNDATHQYKTPGVYNVQLIVESMPDQTGNTARRCGYKRLVVLPRRAR